MPDDKDLRMNELQPIEFFVISLPRADKRQSDGQAYVYSGHHVLVGCLQLYFTAGLPTGVGLAKRESSSLGFTTTLSMVILCVG